LEGFFWYKAFFDLIIEDPNSGNRVAVTITDKLEPKHIMSMVMARIDAKIPHTVITSGEIDPSVEELLEDTNIVVIPLRKVSIVGILSKESGEKLLIEILKILGGLKK